VVLDALLLGHHAEGGVLPEEADEGGPGLLCQVAVVVRKGNLFNFNFFVDDQVVVEIQGMDDVTVESRIQLSVLVDDLHLVDVGVDGLADLASELEKAKV